MKIFVGTVALSLLCVAGIFADDSTVNQTLGVLDEKVNKLTAQMEDLQIRYQQLQKTMDQLQTDLIEVRKAVATAGGAAPDELKALEDRIAAVDAARKKDRQTIIDQLAKELASIGSGKPPSRSPASADANEHIVAKGDTLSSIAKTYGVTVAELKKANDLTGNDIKIGQKLAIPK